MDPNIFFPTKSDSVTADIDYAKTICNQCGVREQCLEYNLSNPPLTDDPGIWGGKTANERAQLRKARRTQQRQSDE